jgi:hypothetical protein
MDWPLVLVNKALSVLEFIQIMFYPPGGTYIQTVIASTYS